MSEDFFKATPQSKKTTTPAVVLPNIIQHPPTPKKRKRGKILILMVHNARYTDRQLAHAFIHDAVGRCLL